MEITLYYDDQFKLDRTDYSSATITRFKSAKAFWNEMNNGNKFIKIDGYNNKFDDENIKYIRKDRIIEIWVKRGL